MITIFDDVWRADSIAGICLEKDEVQIFLNCCIESIDYECGSEEKAQEVHERVVSEWKSKLGKY